MTDEARNPSSTRRFPPMGALAVMAHELAVKRTGYNGMFMRNKDGSQHPGVGGKCFGRKYWEGCPPLSSTTAEYFHIIQRFERGEETVTNTSEEQIPGANDMAYPALDTTQTPNNTVQVGLTKRELFAAMAMQGFLATSGTGPGSIEDFAMDAVQAADALLKELAK